MLFPHRPVRPAKYLTYHYDQLQFAGAGFFIQNYDNGQLGWMNHLPINDLEPEYFICPFVIIAAKDFDYEHCNTILTKLIGALDFFEGNKEKHIFFQLGGAESIFPCLKESIVFRENCRQDEQSKPMFYSVPKKPRNKDIRLASVRLSFQGTLRTNDLRQKMWSVCSKIDGCVLKNTGPYFMALPEADRIILQCEYIKLMIDSQFVLCPKGESVNSIRFFETISAGRIPVLISDDLRLPLSHMIDYNKFVVRVPESDIDNLDKYVRDFPNDLKYASDQAILASREFKNLRSFLDNSL